MTEDVRDTIDMLAGMTPSLREGEFIFCSFGEDDMRWQSLHPLGWFREAEGITLILDRVTAERAGIDVSLPMRQITLEVHSALDGVELTAGVAAALSKADIPCNVVAAFHHDHIFVPAAKAEAALKALQEAQAAAQKGLK